MKVGKKFLMLIVLSAAFLMVAGRANADLLGLSAGTFPDIYIDGTLVIDYDIISANQGTLTIDGTDEKIKFSNAPDDWQWLYQTTNPKGIPQEGEGYIHFNLTVNLNPSTGDVIDGYMTEIVKFNDNGILTKNYVNIAGTQYDEGDLILGGSLINFGWGNVSGVARFDALLDGDTNSKLDIWPDFVNPIGIAAANEANLPLWADEWWKSDQAPNFVYIKACDKFPTPEPASVLLLGMGLFGLFGLAIKKRKN